MRELKSILAQLKLDNSKFMGKFDKSFDNFEFWNQCRQQKNKNFNTKR